VRQLLFIVLGLLAVLLLAAVIWTPYLSLIPGFKPDEYGGVAQVRLLGAGALVAVLALRFLVRPPRKPNRKTVVWSEFAKSTGGAVTEELRRFDSSGMIGGLTVRWDSRGVGMKLTTSRDTDGNDDTRFHADVRLTRPFQFHLVPDSMLTKVLFSSQLWNVALRAVKARETQAGMPTVGPGVAERMAFMAAKEVLLGDPRLDDAFLIKTDTPALARELLTDAGVSSWLLEMSQHSKNWQLSLMARGVADEYELALAVPGVVLDPQGLDASRKLMEASIRCLSDRGALASQNPRAA